MSRSYGLLFVDVLLAILDEDALGCWADTLARQVIDWCVDGFCIGGDVVDGISAQPAWVAGLVGQLVVALWGEVGVCRILDKLLGDRKACPVDSGAGRAVVGPDAVAGWLLLCSHVCGKPAGNVAGRYLQPRGA